MLRVGLTGGIGSGKSTAARRFAERGAVLVDSDVLARDVVAPGTTGLGEIVATFGTGVLAPDGSLERPALAAVVFGDPEVRVRRLVDARGMAEADARARIATQASDDARRAAADVVLDNGGPPEALRAAVDDLWDGRLVPFEANLRARRPVPAPSGRPVEA